MTELSQRVHAALPQTQCTRCGFSDCQGYAQAISEQGEPINQCPPGGREGIGRLSSITGQPVLPLSPAHGAEGPRKTMFIDEVWCIGCTLCIKVCPTDAIVGVHKSMHTVLERHCTGCELCLPVCPVDCILTETATPGRSGWAAWSTSQAQEALQRYTRRQERVRNDALTQRARRQQKAEEKLADLAGASQITDAHQLDIKRKLIESALAKARGSAPS